MTVNSTKAYVCLFNIHALVKMYVLKAKHELLRSNDIATLTSVQEEQKASIAKCKDEYRQKIESNFNTNNIRSCWQGLKTLTGYTKAKSTSVPPGSEQDLAEKLNTFYTQFEKPDTCSHP